MPLLALMAVGLVAAFQFGPVGEHLPDLGPSERSVSSLGRQPVLSEEYPVFGSTELVTHLERGMLAHEEHIEVSSWAQDMDPEQILDAAQEAGTQNPYIFTRGWRVQTFGSRTTVIPTYVYAEEQSAQRRVETREAVARGIASADVLRATTDAEKAARIHDFIVTYADYDESALTAIDRDLDFSLVAQSQEAHGILVAGTAVCTGYAQAFVAMAEEAGLDAVTVTGTDSLGLTGELHAWNKVLIEGRWLVVDATWDDPIGGPDEPLRDYFLLDASDPLLATRQADTEWAVAESLDSFGS
ncbi:transglutaminase domain-containing protein [Demequina muriae]|uniref:Transglutaminase domain-containing protein n=1 Tax=Demequina muriae TaxID=3051664 RepID=A0ABT8GER0_9MICO|nr:transglutaminase domain-containing protein [Demequina sp. EGI L300058]MDN4479446.1 transglutaminase domain-containing protein [Demequina sp. EGI L300058]